jgi:hypothetical protein
MQPRQGESAPEVEEGEASTVEAGDETREKGREDIVVRLEGRGENPVRQGKESGQADEPVDFPIDPTRRGMKSPHAGIRVVMRALFPARGDSRGQAQEEAGEGFLAHPDPEGQIEELAGVGLYDADRRGEMIGPIRLAASVHRSAFRGREELEAASLRLIDRDRRRPAVETVCGHAKKRLESAVVRARRR